MESYAQFIEIMYQIALMMKYFVPDLEIIKVALNLINAYQEGSKQRVTTKEACVQAGVLLNVTMMRFCVHLMKILVMVVQLKKCAE